MKIVKYSLSLFAAFILGVGVTILIFRPVYIDELSQNELDIKLLQVQDFAFSEKILRKKGEKYSYCYRYKTAVENAEFIKKRVNEINYDDSTVTLKMTLDWAKVEIDNLEKLKNNLRYDCNKT